jgi:hypothetical protein
MSTIRRICSRQDWIGFCNVDSVFFEEVEIIVQACIDTIRGPAENDIAHHTQIWSDASTTAIAAVHPQQRSAFSQKISCTNRQICYAEILAGFLGFHFLPAANDWVVDNTAASRAMIRGHSGSAACDALLRSWIRFVHTPTFVTWVDTNCQIADSLTRNGQHVQKPCSAVHTCNRVRWGKEGAGLFLKTHAN